MPTAHLVDRGVISVSGADAQSLLQGLITCDVEALAPGAASAGALLTPQGKILFDFQIVRAPDAEDAGFLLDVAAASAADFARQLNFYKLRAKVSISNRSDEFAVLAGWGADAAPLPGVVWTDPRLDALGQRAIAPVADLARFENSGAPAATAEDYRAHRISLGVPEGSADFAYGEVFPHEADLDQIGGVAFAKGCYVGQEVVSRMHHRGTARTRMVMARLADGASAAQGDDIMAGDRRIGDLRAVSGSDAIAMVRIDKLADAWAAGAALTVNGAAVTLDKQPWASFAIGATEA